ncbi:MAG: GH92 family glycosyl hydrolase [Terriglobia bacterium]
MMRKVLKSSLPIFLFISLMLLSVNGKSRPGQSGAKTAAPTGPTDDVNTFVGTAGPDMGNTYPGAALPFGMIQWSPETTTGFIKHDGSYFYGDEGIRGFSLTHLSGPGCPIMGDVLIQPVVGGVAASPVTSATAYLAKFSHSNEEASPGFYSVGFDNGAKVQLAVTTRAGIGKFAFPAATDSTILFDVGRDGTGVNNASIEITGDNKIAGSVSTSHFCVVTEDKYTVYFAAEFSRPFTSFGTWNGPSVNNGQRSVTGPGTGGWVGFDTTKDQVVEMKVALSYVSEANARMNLAREIPGWNFGAVREAAHNRWNHDLGLITVKGGTDDQKRVFYTALYHALLHPNTFSDVNGQYIGFDDKIHLAKGFTQYANYSGWDIYRCEVQLIAMLFPKAASDMVQSLVMDEQQGGGLPLWPVANDEACQMVGNPSPPIIADIYAFGGRSFDTKPALAAMLRGATVPNAKAVFCPEWDDLESYLKYGYLGPDTIRWHKRRSGPSHTLEFTTTDFSIAQFAQAIGDQSTYQTFMKRAQFWRNIFDTQTGYVEPRRYDGTFIKVDPAESKYYVDGNEARYVEGNAAQYSWMVPYNMRALFDLMGGNAAVVGRLDKFFTELNAGENKPYFWIGNEPVFAVPWAYDFAGAPWGAQSVTRRVELELFTAQPDGEPGNDDLGAMSAWYVFAALGAYPAIPGVGGLALNSPLFSSATIHLGNGKIVKIEGENASDSNPYVQSLRVNGQPSEKTWIPYSTLSQGLTLQFKLGNTPNKEWGTKPEDAPPSFAQGMEAPGK